jgi:Ca-activated chloride channel homolog
MKRATQRLLLLLLGVGRAATQDAQPYQVSVNVDLVVLNATVRDQKGRAAPDLLQQDFEVFEDGIRQSLRLFRHEDIPVTVGLVIDHSGSMRPKLASVIAAARTFIQSSSPEDQVFVVNFNENVTLGLPTEIPFTNRPEDLSYAISHTPATGRTALYDAVWKARKWAAGGSRDKKVLIVISDGGDNASTHTLNEVLQAGNKSNIQVFTIGIFDPEDPDKNPAVLRQLARSTGGEAFVPNELGEVVSVCESIARDIRSQYTLAYLPSGVTQGGGYHSIKVLARGAGKTKLFVRTRSGYSHGGAPGQSGGGR